MSPEEHLERKTHQTLWKWWQHHQEGYAVSRSSSSSPLSDVAATWQKPTKNRLFSTAAMPVSSQTAWACPSWPWEHHGVPAPTLHSMAFPPRERWSKGWRTCPWESTEGARSFHTIKEVDHHTIHTVQGQLKGKQRLSFHKEPNGEDKRQWVQIAPGEDLTWHKKGIFCGKSSHSLEWPPQTSWRLQDVIGQALRHNHLGCISHRRMIFWAPFYPLLFYSSLAWKGNEVLAKSA